MSIEEYISSGVLESYVMGELSDKERQKVECMALVHEEIGRELAKIEETFELMAMQTAVKPSDELKDRIWADISKEIERPEAPIIDIDQTKSAIDSGSAGFNWMRAASVAAIIGLGALAYVQYNSHQQLSARYSELDASLKESQALAEEQGRAISEAQTELAIMRDPAYTLVQMAGTDNAPESLAKVYWNPSEQDVYLSVGRMAELPAGKVYQLWALDQGVPVDAGTFVPSDSLIKMSNIAQGQAFAVTIEDEGGAESPALETLQVIGEVPA